MYHFNKSKVCMRQNIRNSSHKIKKSTITENS